MGNKTLKCDKICQYFYYKQRHENYEQINYSKQDEEVICNERFLLKQKMELKKIQVVKIKQENYLQVIQTLFQQGRVKFFLGQIQEAEQIMEHVLQIDDNFSPAYFFKGCILYQKDQLLKMKQYMDLSLQYFPNDYHTYSNFFKLICIQEIQQQSLSKEQILINQKQLYDEIMNVDSNFVKKLGILKNYYGVGVHNWQCFLQFYNKNLIEIQGLPVNLQEMYMECIQDLQNYQALFDFLQTLIKEKYFTQSEKIGIFMENIIKEKVKKIMIYKQKYENQNREKKEKINKKIRKFKQMLILCQKALCLSLFYNQKYQDCIKYGKNVMNNLGHEFKIDKSQLKTELIKILIHFLTGYSHYNQKEDIQCVQNLKLCRAKMEFQNYKVIQDIQVYFETHRILGIILMNHNQIQQGLYHLQSAAQYNPIYPEIQYKMGLCNIELLQFETARDSFKREINRQQSLECRVKLVCMEYMTGNIVEGVYQMVDILYEQILGNKIQLQIILGAIGSQNYDEFQCCVWNDTQNVEQQDLQWFQYQHTYVVLQLLWIRIYFYVREKQVKINLKAIKQSNIMTEIFRKDIRDEIVQFIK